MAWMGKANKAVRNKLCILSHRRFTQLHTGSTEKKVSMRLPESALNGIHTKTGSGLYP